MRTRDRIELGIIIAAIISIVASALYLTFRALNALPQKPQPETQSTTGVYTTKSYTYTTASGKTGSAEECAPESGMLLCWDDKGRTIQVESYQEKE